MYVSMSPRAQFFANLGRLGADAVRGVSAAVQQRRGRAARLQALEETADGGDCTPCAEEEARLREEAQAWRNGR